MGAPSPILGQTLGRYRVLEQIGAGGMGLVFRAHDWRLDRDVALKVLPPGTLTDEHVRKRFRHEALALSKLNHPNIGTVHDFDTQDGIDFLVMELVPGVTLDEKLKAGWLPEPEVCRLGGQLAEGLAAAHDQGLIHRDLKPGNLRLTPDGRLKILDFGLAKLLGPVSPEATTDSLSQTHGAVGTLPYMAPEQLRGQPADARSDIWAAGCVLYEMAAGRRPFPQTSAPMLTDAILRQAAVPPRAVNAGVSTELERIITKSLEKDPEHRYQSAKDLGVDLRRLGAPSSVTAASPAPPARTMWSWGALAAGIAAGLGLAILAGASLWQWVRPQAKAGPPHIESLAVLPLQNLSGDPQQEYFADGMTEELITELAQIRALRVISRTSVMQYKGARKPLPEIARELNVDAVVEGSVLRSGERVRITAQLVHAPTDRHLWAHSYERDVRDVLTLQSEVAKDIAGEIRTTLTPEEQRRLAVPRPVNPEAHEAYLRGRYHAQKFTIGSVQKSLEYFEQAIASDPTYAPAYAGLAGAYTTLGFAGTFPPQELFAKAKAAAAKALELDDTLAEAHVSIGWTSLAYDFEWPQAEREFRRALELNPSSATAHYNYSVLLSIEVRHEQAIAEAKRAQALDPLSPLMVTNVGWRYQSARQYEQAIEEFRKALELDPNFLVAQGNIGYSYLLLQRPKEAIAALQATKGLKPSPWLLMRLAQAYVQAGKRTEAQKILGQLKQRSRASYVSPYATAIIHAALGEKDSAFQDLERAYRERDSWLIFLGDDPGFDILRSDPRFQDLLRRIGLPR